MVKYIRLLRPQQWVKNGFIFLPLFFDGQLLDTAGLWSCVTAFLAFSLAASSIYCFNDICDMELDRLHPDKNTRPVASGVISQREGFLMMAVCTVLSLLVFLIFGGERKFYLIALTGFYILMNIAYCLWLKHYSIIDVMIISAGFVLRIVVGGVAGKIWLSEWIVIMAFLLALFLAFAKRRDDVLLYLHTGIALRKHTGRYNPEFLNQVMTVVSTSTIIAYIIYTLSPDVIERFHCRYVYLTSIFVLSGIIRYLQLTIVDLKSGNPTKILLNDRFIQCCITGWLIAFFIIIYL
ncbi:MAG: decaprenyl-phosphate phosphoribosyltransferase [Tannerella sp.]|nr:decaprenyl-phosphate phosphoribosyltransferase [Tannerella sp.]